MNEQLDGGAVSQIEAWNRRAQAEQTPVAGQARVDDLAMLVKKLVQRIRHLSTAKDDTAEGALDYLKRHELLGSPLRASPIYKGDQS